MWHYRTSHDSPSPHLASPRSDQDNIWTFLCRCCGCDTSSKKKDWNIETQRALKSIRYFWGKYLSYWVNSKLIFKIRFTDLLTIVEEVLTILAREMMFPIKKRSNKYLCFFKKHPRDRDGFFKFDKLIIHFTFQVLFLTDVCPNGTVSLKLPHLIWAESSDNLHCKLQPTPT